MITDILLSVCMLLIYNVYRELNEANAALNSIVAFMARVQVMAANKEDLPWQKD